MLSINQNNTLVRKEEKMDTEPDPDNWKIVHQRLNDQVRKLDELLKEVFKDEKVSLPSPPMDYLDIKLHYRKLKIQEQCRQLNPK